MGRSFVRWALLSSRPRGQTRWWDSASSSLAWSSSPTTRPGWFSWYVCSPQPPVSDFRPQHHLSSYCVPDTMSGAFPALISRNPQNSTRRTMAEVSQLIDEEAKAQEEGWGGTPWSPVIDSLLPVLGVLGLLGYLAGPPGRDECPEILWGLLGFFFSLVGSFIGDCLRSAVCLEGKNLQNFGGNVSKEDLGAYLKISPAPLPP